MINDKTIYEALMTTAEHIRRNPDEYRFMTCAVPSSRHCGSPGCALGWLAYFLGLRDISHASSLLIHGELDGPHADDKFYQRLGEFDPRWHEDAQRCANALEDYAGAYHYRREDHEVKTRLKVLGDETPDENVYLGLEQTGGVIRLVAYGSNGQKIPGGSILGITEQGMVLYDHINPRVPVEKGRYGQIKVSND